MFYECEIEVQGSKPLIWRVFIADCELAVAELTKYIRETMHLRYHNPYTYYVFDDNNKKEGYSTNCKSNSYCVVSDKDISSYEVVGGNYKNENEVTICDLFKNCNYSIFEYDSGKFGWSLKISVLSRDVGKKRNGKKGYIVECESKGYGIRERTGDIETQNEEQEIRDKYYSGDDEAE